MFLYYFLYYIVLIFCISLLTLLERYYLAFSQIRLGPSKVFFLGVLQMIFDGIKLFFRENIFLINQDYSIFFFIPIFSFIFILFVFRINENIRFLISILLVFFWLFFILGIIVFFLILVSFYSKSKFSVLSCLRVISVVVSFDIVFIFFCFFFFVIFYDLRFSFFLFFFCLLIFFMSIILIILGDLNRRPFDFLEGESELVRGFNLEISRFFFIFYFLSEYGFIFFFSYFITFHFFYMNFLILLVIFIILIYLRVILPRLRFDFYMVICWLIILWFEIIKIIIILSF